MTEYVENYKIVFDMDAQGGGVNIINGGSAPVANGGGITNTAVGGAGGLFGSILSAMENIVTSKTGKRVGGIGVGRTPLDERVRNIRKFSNPWGKPPNYITGKGTTKVGYLLGEMNPEDLGRSKFRAWNEKDRVFSQAEADFAKAVRSKGWNKQAILESARARWAAQEAAKNTTLGGGLGKPLPASYMGYKMNPSLENPGSPSGLSYTMTPQPSQQTTLIGEYQILNPIDITRKAEYTRK